MIETDEYAVGEAEMTANEPSSSRPGKLLSREDILNVGDTLTEDVEVPEWGGVVRVRGLTGRERDKFEESMFVQKGSNLKRNVDNVRSRLVQLCAVDENGQQLFSKADIELLGNKSAAALERIFTKAQVLSGLRKEDIDELTEELGEE